MHRLFNDTGGCDNCENTWHTFLYLGRSECRSLYACCLESHSDASRRRVGFGESFRGFPGFMNSRFLPGTNLEILKS